MPLTLVRRYAATKKAQPAYRLVIGSDGRVDESQISACTGFSALDMATCGFLERCARFDPATYQTGHGIVGTYTGQVTRQIPV